MDNNEQGLPPAMEVGSMTEAERLSASYDALRAQLTSLEFDCQQLRDEVAAITAERDRWNAALWDAVDLIDENLKVPLHIMEAIYPALLVWLRANQAEEADDEDLPFVGVAE